LTAADDQEPVEALAADAADPTLDVGVRVRRADGSADDPNLRAPQERIEGARELRVSIVE
jgi:hypothetical protein